MSDQLQARIESIRATVASEERIIDAIRLSGRATAVGEIALHSGFLEFARWNLASRLAEQAGYLASFDANDSARRLLTTAHSADKNKLARQIKKLEASIASDPDNEYKQSAMATLKQIKDIQETRK